jgi:hypothetical protein
MLEEIRPVARALGDAGLIGRKEERVLSMPVPRW